MRFVTTERFERSFGGLSNQHALAVEKAVRVLTENSNNGAM